MRTALSLAEDPATRHRRQVAEEIMQQIRAIKNTFMARLVICLLLAAPNSNRFGRIFCF